MKAYYPDTMNRILVDQKFNIIGFWGAYEQSKFHEKSELQIYKCQLSE